MKRQRNRWMRLLGLAVMLAWTGARAEEVKVTFIATSDSHYRVDDGRVEENRVTIEEMNRIFEETWPAQAGGGPIDKPVGVVALGDLLDDGDHTDKGKWGSTAAQWERYVKHFGFDGTDGLLKYSVFETWGNHDGPPVGKEKNGFSTQGNIKARIAKHKEAGRVLNVSESGMQFSWNWGGVHFVMMGIYPADQSNPKVRYSAVWHNPQNALAFVKEDLKKHVGDSGRPVVLMSHCGFDTDWWHAEDKAAFYEAVKDYNVVLFLYGHTGTGVGAWSPTPEQPKMPYINTGHTTSGFFVVQITNDRVRAAYRAKEMKGEQHVDGRWTWRFLLNKPIQAVTPGGLAGEGAAAAK